MNVEVIPFRRLGADHLLRWESYQCAAPMPLNSPFFHPGFSELVDNARGDVEVAVVERDGEVAAYLPFHRMKGNAGKPVGLWLNDFQGFIGRPGFCCDLEALVRDCRLRSYDFDHVPDSQASFASQIGLKDGSPFIDLNEREHAQEDGISSNFRRDTERRERKLQKELGPIRVEHGCRDVAVLQTILAWKRGQFQSSGVPDVLSDEWVQQMVPAYLDRTDDRFRGVLSALWAGDRLVAGELSLRSGPVYHSQWCSYDPAAGQYAPGRLLTRRIIEWAGSSGIRWYDFGKGMFDYKTRFMTGHTLVGTGRVVANPVSKALNGAWWTIRRWVRESPLRAPAKAAASYYLRMRYGSALAKEAS